MASETQTPDETGQQSRPPGLLRLVVALAIGLAGCVLLWVVTPFTYYILRLENITDSYLPAGTLFLLTILALAVNPLLRRWRPAWVLSRSQLVLVVGMWLTASVIPIQGVLFQLPFSLADVCVQTTTNRSLADAHAEAGLPAALFPDPIEYGVRAPASESLLGELPRGEAVLWGRWAGPLGSWGAFLLFYGLLMVGLSLVVLPQWRHNERLPFPLVEVYESLIQTPSPPGRVPPLFRSRAFWIGAGMVFLLYFLHGLSLCLPGQVPAIPLTWNLQRCFTEEPFVYMPRRMYENQLYFLFVGISFFMPTRISFSIWSMMIVYTAYIVAGRAYFPPFYYSTISDHRSGAILVLTATVLWFGRDRWRAVLRAALNGDGSAEARRDRRAALFLAVGMVGLGGWFVWAGAQFVWACVFVLIAFSVCLLITRFVAETGMPFFRIDGINVSVFMALVPGSWLTAATVFMSGVTEMLFQMGCRVNVMTMATHALALDEERATADRASVSRQPRLALLFVLVLLFGLAVGGAALVSFCSHHGTTLDGFKDAVGSPTAFSRSHRLMLDLGRGQVSRPAYNRVGHLVFGAGLAASLQWACLALPKWPLHPIGILIVYTYYGTIAWASIFVGWMVKIIVVRYGGARLYRSAKPFFLGLIIGEVLAAVFWVIVPCVLVALGQEYTAIRIQPP